jgi:hypothetical protein
VTSDVFLITIVAQSEASSVQHFRGCKFLELFDGAAVGTGAGVVGGEDVECGDCSVVCVLEDMDPDW